MGRARKMQHCVRRSLFRSSLSFFGSSRACTPSFTARRGMQDLSSPEPISRPNFYSLDQTDRVERETTSYFVIGTSAVTIGVGAVEGVRAVLTTMSPAADVLAMANIEVDLSSVNDDSVAMRDQQTDAQRTKNPKYLIVLGVCTHLGCVPIANAGDYGGYFCPCRGSHYDTSGRIRKGPAPLNLEVPPHAFLEDKVIVGVDEI